LRRLQKAVLKESELTNRKQLSDIANNYLYYGLHKYPDKWVFREWAPHADKIYLIGNFSSWALNENYQLKKTNNGNWEIGLPLDVLHHGDLYKLLVIWDEGTGERLPTYARRVVQDPVSKIFSAQVWQPEKLYKWKYKRPQQVNNPLIYEAHIGMSSEKEEIASFDYFRRKVLPRIAENGYNTIQLMAIQEHPYYGSFGYQVSNFFAVSSRFGTPDELKKLIDEAHHLGLAVILDMVHSHAVRNESEGLSRFDGSYDLYFHPGEQGVHPVWDSRLFNYGKDETILFLLSNCKYWLEEFHFDGFRFDGVTSMIYYDHGIGRDFTNYLMYYDGNQDEDAIAYLTLANRLIHQVYPGAITIAEDVSGMPGLAIPLKDGGIGFDFRMAMGVADFWVKNIKFKPDEEWHVGDMFYELTNKRKDEKTISYAESHDQAMVGDQTIVFRLMGDKMYTSMNIFERDIVIDRGMCLHKMIRLISLATAGNGYLNFMGNEFGHPEWIDFPREGNKWSYKYARRQWSMTENANLRYRFLGEFDKAMLKLVKQGQFFDFRPFAIVQNNSDQVLVFKRGDLLFIFNFNPSKSFPDYGFEIDPGSYRVALSSDSARFDGFGRIDENSRYFTQVTGTKNILKVYIPARTALALQIEK
jgi:1,4-alpha-glucan branching enzyme